MTANRAAPARPWLGAVVLAAALWAAAPAHAGASGYCDDGSELDAAQKSRLLRFAAVIRDELAASGSTAALVSRSGLDLGRFGQRYSHAGIALRHSPATPWAVRQLYYACDEGRPRLFDQGLAAFVLGLQSPDIGHVAVQLLPVAAAAALERAALDKRLALSLLAADYSANAHPFSTRFQNCNQWVAELMAGAWGGPVPGRAAAQRWLRAQGYEPVRFEGSLWHFLGAHFVPFIHRAGHPEDDLQAGRYRVSMPASLQALVRRLHPGGTTLEFCHDGTRVVVRRDGAPLDAACVPAAGDRVVALD